MEINQDKIVCGKLISSIPDILSAVIRVGGWEVDPEVRFINII